VNSRAKYLNIVLEFEKRGNQCRGKKDAQEFVGQFNIMNHRQRCGKKGERVEISICCVD
jgi:hypothetical protein